MGWLSQVWCGGFCSRALSLFTLYTAVGSVDCEAVIRALYLIEISVRLKEGSWHRTVSVTTVFSFVYRKTLNANSTRLYACHLSEPARMAEGAAAMSSGAYSLLM